MAPQPKRGLRWQAFALVVAMVAIGAIAVGAWLRPLPDSKSHSASPVQKYTDQQVAEAKQTVCAAYEKVHHAVIVNTGRAGGNDPTSVLGLAANARIALYDGGGYLLTTLAKEPATPADLAEATRALADSYQQLAIDYMAEAPQSEIQSALHTADGPNATVYKLCK